METLKLVALDEEDLNIISAHVQDAVMKASDLVFEAGDRRFAMAMNRFAWETETTRGFLKRSHQRRRTVLHFDRVLSVKSVGIDRNKPDEVLSLLAVHFVVGEAPSGMVELIFSGDAAIRLDVECIEARLADLGAAWETPAQPKHAT